jgi:hypothetical protein
MSQILLLKIGTDGIPTEMSSSTDDITLASYTVTGGGPALSATGLDLNNQDVSDIKDINVNAPSTSTINQTAGNLIVDNIMGKDRANAMAVGSDILFPVITDVAGEVDAFRLPELAGVPSATPTAGGPCVVYDSTDKKLFIWNGTAWDDQSSVSSAESIDNAFIADGAIAIRDIVYISAADKVKKAKGDAVATSEAIGFATNAAADLGAVSVRNQGVVTGFSSLTPGAKYYVSAATAGLITSTIPNGAGHIIMQVGYAKNTTDIFCQIQVLGRRA